MPDCMPICVTGDDLKVMRRLVGRQGHLPERDPGEAMRRNRGLPGGCRGLPGAAAYRGASGDNRKETVDAGNGWLREKCLRMNAFVHWHSAS